MNVHKSSKLVFKQFHQERPTISIYDTAESSLATTGLTVAPEALPGSSLEPSH